MKKLSQRRRFHPYTSLKNKKRANGLGGRQSAAAGATGGFQYMGSGLMEGLLFKLLSNRGRSSQGDRG